MVHDCSMAHSGRSSDSSDEVSSRLPLMHDPVMPPLSPASDAGRDRQQAPSSRPPSSLAERGLSFAQQVGSQVQDLLYRAIDRLSPRSGPTIRDDRIHSAPGHPVPYFPPEEERNRIRRNLFANYEIPHLPITVQPRSSAGPVTFSSHTDHIGPPSSFYSMGYASEYESRVIPAEHTSGATAATDVLNRLPDVRQTNVTERSQEHDDIYADFDDRVEGPAPLWGRPVSRPSVAVSV